VSAPKSATPEQLEARRRVGEAAAALVKDGMVVGLGTGSTAACAIERLGRRVADEKLKIVGVPTSFSAAELARKAGLEIRALGDVARVDLALDGADEIGPGLALIKGGGAAHAQEKVVAADAERFVVLADESKVVARLGVGWPVPIEVLGFALRPVARALERLGAKPELRRGSGKDGPVVTDHGNLVLDAKFAAIDDPAALARELDAIPGIVEHGLFVGLADEALVGSLRDGTVRRLLP
jgi:ribose 5-phosphate isomerase A